MKMSVNGSTLMLSTRMEINLIFVQCRWPWLWDCAIKFYAKVGQNADYCAKTVKATFCS